MTRWADLFTNRQLVALTTFSDLVTEARERAHKDALATGIPDGDRLNDAGTGASAYADSIATYSALSQSKLANLMSSITTWMSDRGAFRETFARQAIPMTWDFAESNPIGEMGGSWLAIIDKIRQVLENVPCGIGTVNLHDARTTGLKNGLISTDPPYYDNVPYADLSDFFYVWLRRSLREIHPATFATLLTPKAEELIADQYRRGGREGASKYFEEGFTTVFLHARRSASIVFPITVFYAFKQSESARNGESFTGWQTLLEGIVQGGWQITGTWPMRTEGAGRIRATGSNALASSIVLALRPRPDVAPQIDRRGFIAALKDELPGKLRELQQGKIAPVDLPQAAIGPGMAVFTRYSAAIENDGSGMRVRSALERINEVLDEVLAEQEGDFDSGTRFAIAWYRQHGYGVGKFGDADNMARARNTAVEGLERSGVLTSRAGKVALIRPADLPSGYDPLADVRLTTWEVVHHLIRILEAGGLDAAGRFLARVKARPNGTVRTDVAKELAFLLFSIADTKKWSKEAVSFNTLGTAWNDIVEFSHADGTRYEQPDLNEV